MNRENITLIGMPGAGKSTIGVLLAKTMGYDFVDTDLLMQRQYGDVLHVLLRQNGLDRFKEMEERTLLGFSARHTVVATAGAPYTATRACGTCARSVPSFISTCRSLSWKNA